MRVSHGNWSAFCAGDASPPPKFVRLGSTVFRYESYSRGQFVPQTFGSTVSSVTSTSRTYCCFASVLRWMMFTRSAVVPATATAVTTAMTVVSCHIFFSGTFGSMSRLPLVPRGVPDAAMAMNAQHRVLVRRAPVHQLRDHVSVAGDTVLLEDARVPGPDADRLRKVLQRERLAVVPAVHRLRPPLRQKAVWQVALHAGRHCVVRAVLPGGVLLPHDVAVHARPRIRRDGREP